MRYVIDALTGDCALPGTIIEMACNYSGAPTSIATAGFIRDAACRPPVATRVRAPVRAAPVA